MPTIKDISRLTGISVTQVSRALNNHLDVSQATKEKVNRVAKEIGYVANRSAQNLVTQKKQVSCVDFIKLRKIGR